MTGENWIIAIKVSEAFNREAKNVKAVLAKYNAHLDKTSVGHGLLLDIAVGVDPTHRDAFIKEFKTLPGVKGVHVQPQPCYPW